MNEGDSELLMRYLDGECTPEERTALERRLETDPQTAKALEAMRAQQQGWQALPAAISKQAVEEDWEELKKKILTEEIPADKPHEFDSLAWKPYWTWGAAAAVFALASVVFFLPHSDPSVHSATPFNVVETVETDLDGATPIIYVDKRSGWSVVWVDEAAAS